MESTTKETISYLLGEGAKRAQLNIQHLDPAQGLPMTLVPEGMEVMDLTPYLPACPDRKRVRVDLNSVESFIEYVNEHKSSDTRIFASMNEAPYTMTAAIDYHQAGADGNAEYITHIVVLKLQTTDEWVTWHGNNKKAFEHVEFALFIEENMIDIVEPESATLMEIALSLQVKENGHFTSAHKLQDGTTHLEYKADMEASAGQNGSLEIPEKFRLAIPVFRGVPVKEIEAYFRYRKNGGKLALLYQLIRPQKVIDEMVQTAIAQVKSEVELPVFDGSYIQR